MASPINDRLSCFSNDPMKNIMSFLLPEELGRVCQTSRILLSKMFTGQSSTPISPERRKQYIFMASVLQRPGNSSLIRWFPPAPDNLIATNTLPIITAALRQQMESPDHEVTEKEYFTWEFLHRGCLPYDEHANHPDILNLSFEESHLKEDEILQIIAHCPRLKKLNLSSCAQITDCTLKAIAERCPYLQYLDLAKCNLITDAGLARLNGPNLQHLRLYHCDKITNAGLANLHCPNLRYLNLAFCNLITDAGLASLRCPNLQDLDLSRCTLITDDGLASLRCSKLRNLHLCNSNLITNAGLASFVAHCPDLQYLGLRGCGQITRVHVASLAAQFPKLFISR